MAVVVATAYVRSSRIDNKTHTIAISNSRHLPHPTQRHHDTTTHTGQSEHRYHKMVATRRGAKKAAEPAPAAPTLNAPPKRGGRKKAVVEEAAPEPAPAAKPIKAAVSKRKAKAQPEAAELPAAKKPTMNTKATRAAKVETKAAPAPAAPKRATRGKKIVEPEAIEEPAVVEEAPKPAATRGRKAAVKKAPAPKIEEPVVEEPAIEEEPAAADEPMVDEAPKPATRGRNVPAKKTAVAKHMKAAPHKAPIAVKPAPRARKAAAPKPSLPPPVAATRATRGRNVAAPAQDSPLKAPARKPAKKAAAVVAKAQPAVVAEAAPSLVAEAEPAVNAKATPSPSPVAKAEPATVEEPFTEFPGYPTTPAHIAAPMSTKDALAALPSYPKTPAHIVAPIGNKAMLAEMPGYPKTPAHIRAPISVQAAMNEMPGYPKTPAHITAPVLPLVAETEEVKEDLVEYVNTPAHVDAMNTEDNAMNELPDYPETPAHIQAPLANKEALNELPDYPKTPAHIQAPMSSRKALGELPVDYIRTPAHVVAASTPSTIGLSKLTADCFGTPLHRPSPMPIIEESAAVPEDPSELTADCSGTPFHVSSPVIAEEVAAEAASEGPETPQKLVWGVTNQEAFNELPDEIADASEVTDCDNMDVDTEVSVAQPMPKLQLAPIALNAPSNAPEPASPLKSALRSPQKFETKTPKKAVTWDEHEESDLFNYGGPLAGLTFFVDITSHGKEHNYIFMTLLEDMGAKIAKEWQSTGITHVLFKDGNKETLEKVLASKGAIKCVNVGWILECEQTKSRVEESPYLVDLSVVMPQSPLPTAALNAYTPARTPSRYALPPSSECKSIPDTPTSSEIDHSLVNDDDDKENSEVGLFFRDSVIKTGIPRTCPPKKASVLFSRSPMRTPSKINFMGNSPLKPFSTSKKRSLDTSSSLGLSMSVPPKKLRLF
ncbi:hypothetical protein SNOG_00745 [Parastagonospora nodorum SN15]|uniref:BRCT domain-containing protein n=1 Tax=Phaeosphaeria nodorum (strain SN15 / ATCC MYA-4574 / FGSC 10173) TaxID=321614 RepID=Q0V5G9_PHANO|nr:hypothetical protein SNOG_00745 [Parastagonospora nodorum SN15]EAT92240.1 hypothetical protein SNOG_00745 [Parastagonospora nodorum SN15]